MTATSELALQALQAERQRQFELLQLHGNNRDRAEQLAAVAEQLIAAADARLTELDAAIRDMRVAGWRIDADPEADTGPESPVEPLSAPPVALPDAETPKTAAAPAEGPLQ